MTGQRTQEMNDALQRRHDGDLVRRHTAPKPRETRAQRERRRKEQADHEAVTAYRQAQAEPIAAEARAYTLIVLRHGRPSSTVVVLNTVASVEEAMILARVYASVLPRECDVRVYHTDAYAFDGRIYWSGPETGLAAAFTEAGHHHDLRPPQVPAED